MPTVLEQEDLWFNAWFQQFVKKLNELDQKKDPSSEQGESAFEHLEADSLSIQIETNAMALEDVKKENVAPMQSIQPKERGLLCVTTGNQQTDFPFLYVQNTSALLGWKDRVMSIKMILYCNDERTEDENKWLRKIRAIMHPILKLEVPKTLARFTECKMEKSISDKKIRFTKLEFSARIIWNLE